MAAYQVGGVKWKGAVQESVDLVGGKRTVCAVDR